jgi:large subunit ribosomal protein L31
MQKTIHPTWNNDITVTCACGSTFISGSTFPSLRVDICSACHPFFTGEMKFVDTQGRVDKLIQKMHNAQARQAATTSKKAGKVQKADDQKSYKQLLQEQRSSVNKTDAPAA